MELEQLKELMRDFDASHLTGMELELEGVVLRLKKDPAPVLYTGVPVPAPGASIQASVPAPTPAAEPAPDAGSTNVVVRAPLVGIAYAAEKPGAVPYVSVGKAVKKGDPVCLIEAMKMMNEVASPVNGVVRAVLFENEAMVGFDAPLVEIEEQ